MYIAPDVRKRKVTKEFTAIAVRGPGRGKEISIPHGSEVEPLALTNSTTAWVETISEGERWFKWKQTDYSTPVAMFLSSTEPIETGDRMTQNVESMYERMYRKPSLPIPNLPTSPPRASWLSRLAEILRFSKRKR